jgi:hypothetical protein
VTGRPFYVARRRPAATGGLYVQTGSSIHHRPVVDRCRVPTPEGPCGHPMFEGESRESFERGHVVPCLRRNHDTIMQERARQHPDIMRPWDPELATWVKRHGDAILEGRKRI